MKQWSENTKGNQIVKTVENAMQQVDDSRVSIKQWNFRGCPKREQKYLPYCAHYEYARLSDTIRAMYPLARAPRSLQEIQNCGIDERPWVDRFPRGPIWPSRIIGGFRAFMHLPWLEIPSDIRRGWLEALFPGELPHRAHVRTAMMISPLDDHDRLDDLLRQRYIYDDEGRLESLFVTVQINLRHSNVQIRDACMWELKRLRAKCPKQNRFKSHSGATSYHDLLKVLGAYRLLEKYGWEEAAKLTEAHLKDKNGRPAPLYVEQSAWLAAKRQAKQLIKHLETTGCIDPIVSPLPDK
jgi:hypothetical protein